MDIDKDVVRRIVGKHYGLESGSGGPSWLTFLGQAMDSLWSIDLFRCESLSLRTHWVLVVMDQFTRRIIGFDVLISLGNQRVAPADKLAAEDQRCQDKRHQDDCSALHVRLLLSARRNCRWAVPVLDVPASDSRASVPKYLSTDNDPLYRFHQWQANLRVCEVMEIKTVPYVPLSHPFVERLVGTLRRECLDRTLFWTSADLEAKLREFQKYFNEHRTHAGLEGRLPDASGPGSRISFSSYRWQKHCRGLYQTPIAA